MTVGLLYQKISFAIAEYHGTNFQRPQGLILNPDDWELFDACYRHIPEEELCGVAVSTDPELPRGSFKLTGLRYHNTADQPRTKLIRDWVTMPVEAEHRKSTHRHRRVASAIAR